MSKVDVDFDKLLKYSKELIEYEDVLPLLIRAVIIKQWSNNLNKKGLWINIHKKCIDTKPTNYNDAVKELVEWCEENKDYEDIIIRVKN